MQEFEYISFGPYPDDEKLKLLEEKNAVIVNCTSPEDKLKPYQTSCKVLKYQIDEKFEPDCEDEFVEFLDLLILKLKEGAYLYVHSREGGGRAAFVTLCLLCKHENYYTKEIIPSITKEYHSRTDINPYFRLTSAPRSIRQLMFARKITRSKNWKDFVNRHGETINPAATRNRCKYREGDVRMAWVNNGETFRNKRWPQVRGYKGILTSTSTDEFWRELNPCFLGPVDVWDKNWFGEMEIMSVKNIQNLWMGSQVYEEWTDENGDPTIQYFDNKWKIWTEGKAYKTHPFVSRDKKPLYYWWQGHKLPEWLARMVIYAQLYEQKVKKTEPYRELELLKRDGYNLLLLDYKGYDLKEEGINIMDAFTDESRPMTHSLVLYGMLTGRTPWHLPIYEGNKE